MIKLLKINEHYIHPDRLVYAWAHYRNQRAMFKVDAEDNGTTIDFDLEGDAAQRALVWLDANSIDILATTPAVDVDVKELQGRLHAVRCLLDLAQNERGAAIAEREQWKANANNAADHYGRVLTDRDEWRNEATRLADELDAANTDRTALRADLQKARDRISDFHALQAELDAARKRIAELEPPFKPGDVVHLNSLARFRDATVVSTSTTHYVRVAYSYGDGDDLSYTYPASDLLLVSRADESEAGND